MYIRPDDKLPNGNTVIEDRYYKVNIDIMLLKDRLRLVKNKMGNTPWYRIGTWIGLRKELSCIERESDEIMERLVRLHTENINPIKIVKRV